MHRMRRMFGWTMNPLFILTNTMLTFLRALPTLPDLRNIDEPDRMWVQRLGQQSPILLILIIKFMILKSLIQVWSIHSSLVSPSP